MSQLTRTSTIAAATTSGAVGGASLGAVLLTIGGFAVGGPAGAALGWAAGAGLGAAGGAVGGAHLGKRIANAIEGDGDEAPSSTALVDSSSASSLSHQRRNGR